MHKRKILLHTLTALFEKRYDLFVLTIAFLSFVPIFEIVIYKQLVDLVINSFGAHHVDLLKLVHLVLLITLLILIAALTYYFKILRIKYINLLTVHKRRKRRLKPVTANWYRSSLLESTLILVGLVQISLIGLLTIYISYGFSLIFIVLITIVLAVIYRHFITEMDNQKEFIRKEFQLKRSQSSHKILSRIVSSESSTFLASLVMYVVLLFDLVFFYFDHLDKSQFIAFVFVAKYLGGSFGMLSSSIMRLARSLAYTMKVFMER